MFKRKKEDIREERKSVKKPTSAALTPSPTPTPNAAAPSPTPAATGLTGGRDSRPISVNMNGLRSTAQLQEAIQAAGGLGAGKDEASSAEVVTAEGDLGSVEEGLLFTGELVSGRPIIKGGTLERLVERLTYEKYPDPDYLKAFMLTYRSFTTPIDLLTMLKNRYNLKTAAEATTKEIEEFEANVLRPVRLRVFNVLKHWITSGFNDFQQDSALLEVLKDFISNTMMNTGMENPAKQLEKLMEKQLSGEEAKKKLMFSQQPPAPYLPMNMGSEKLSLMALHPEEVARQMTLMEYALYTSIQPYECLGQAWNKPDKETKAPNILSMVKRFNVVSNWFATEVLRGENLRDRIKILTRVIEIAEFCKQLNNLNAMMEIISGLQDSSIFRLKQTWAGLSPKALKSYEDMQAIVSREQNYKNFRAYLHDLNPPCIPYLGVYLTDLTFIEDGNQNSLPGGLINFSKRQKISQVITEIQQYQQTPYCLEKVHPIVEYLQGVEIFDEKTRYNVSLQREERQSAAQREKEKEKEREKQNRDRKKDEKQKPKEDESIVLPAIEEDNTDFGDLEPVPGYLFDTEDNEKNIIFAKDSEEFGGAVKGGTLVKFVERLTSEKLSDVNFLTTFLMTYKSFTTAEELLRLLKMRFNMPQPRNKAKLEKFKSTRMLPIHTRILNVMKNWVERYPVDFIEDSNFAGQFETFLEDCIKANKMLEKLGAQIKANLLKKLDSNLEISYEVFGSQCQKKDINDHATIIDFDVEQIAQGLCHLEHSNFAKIEPRECMLPDFIAEEARKKAAGILNMKANFDAIKRWTATEISKERLAKIRFKVLSHFVRIAEVLLALKNFNSFVAVVQGIGSLGQYLTVTWEWVPAKIVESYEKMQSLVKSNKNLRELERPEGTVVTSTVPFIESHMRQLVGFHDMLPDNLTADLINFEKRRKIHDIFFSWSQYQAQPYTFEDNKVIRAYLLRAHLLPVDEVASRAQAWDSDHPTERAQMDILPNPPKRTDNALLLSQSTVPQQQAQGMSPRSQQRLDKKIHKAMLQVLQEDKELFTALLAETKKQIEAEMRAEMKDYAGIVKDYVTVYQGLQKSNEGQVVVAAKDIVTRQFAGYTVTEWSAVDEEGFVFGWSDTVRLYIVEGDDGRWLVHVAFHVDVPELGVLLRAVSLFQQSNGKKKSNHQVAVITPSITSEAFEIAEQRGVTVYEF